MVLYFTGTGNSRYIAERIASRLGDELFCINDAIKLGSINSIKAKQRIVFVFPTYAWRIPRIVKDWILKTPFEGEKRAWFVMNCGDSIGNAEKYNKSLCREKAFAYMGTAQIIMPENYIAMFNTPGLDEARRIVLKAEPEIDKAAKLIEKGHAFSANKNNPLKSFLSGPANAVFYPAFVKSKAFYAADSCIGCEKCAKLCPLNNITMKNGRPHWNNNCTHCMACIGYCPKKAIEYGKKSKKRERYNFESLNYIQQEKSK